MATTTGDPSELIDKLIHRIGSQESTLQELDSLLRSNALDRLRQDRLEELRTLQQRIENDINNLQAREASAACSHAQTSLIGSAAGLIFGSLAASMRGVEKPIYNGIKISQEMLRRISPSGTIMVAIRRSPFEVEAVSISKKARDLAITEADALNSLKDKGYYIINVDKFAQIVDEIRTDLINGVTSIAIGIGEQLIRCAARF